MYKASVYASTVSSSAAKFDSKYFCFGSRSASLSFTILACRSGLGSISIQFFGSISGFNPDVYIFPCRLSGRLPFGDQAAASHLADNGTDSGLALTSAAKIVLGFSFCLNEVTTYFIPF